MTRRHVAAWICVTAALWGCAAAARGATITVEPAPSHLWAGEQVTVAVRVAVDEGPGHAWALAWRLVLQGAVLDRGRQKVAPAPGEALRVAIPLRAPEVRHRSPVELQVALVDATESVATVDRTFIVYPVWDSEPLQRALETPDQIAVVGSTGRLTEVFSRRALRFTRLTLPDLVRGFRGQVLLLGPEAADTPDLAQSALEAAARGLTVLWLEPVAPAKWWERWKLPLTRVADGARRIVAPTHPALQSLVDDDLASWRGEDGASPAMEIPRAGNFRPLISAGDSPAAYSLLELFPGAGRIVLCQLPVLTCFEDEPAARLLLQSLLDYALTPPDPFASAFVWAPPGHGLLNLADKAQVSLVGDDIIAAQPAGSVAQPSSAVNARDATVSRLMIVAADARAAEDALAAGPAIAERIRTHLEGGGKCLFIGAEPDSGAFLEKCGLRDVAFAPSPPAVRLKGRPLPVAAGLSAALLAAALRGGGGRASRPSVGEAASFDPVILSGAPSVSEARSRRISPSLSQSAALVFPYSVSGGSGADVAVSSGAIVKVRVGRGEAVMCQLRLDLNADNPAAVTVFRLLLTNLGCRLES